MTTTAGRPNLDGDLCICKCAVPPRLISNKSGGFSGHTFENGSVDQHKGSAGWLAHSGVTMEEHGFNHDQHFQIVDERTGEPMARVRYQMECDGELVTGITDSEGHTSVIYSKGMKVTLIKLEQSE